MRVLHEGPHPEARNKVQIGQRRYMKGRMQRRGHQAGTVGLHLRNRPPEAQVASDGCVCALFNGGPPRVGADASNAMISIVHQFCISSAKTSTPGTWHMREQLLKCAWYPHPLAQRPARFRRLEGVLQVKKKRRLTGRRLTGLWTLLQTREGAGYVSPKTFRVDRPSDKAILINRASANWSHEMLTRWGLRRVRYGAWDAEVAQWGLLGASSQSVPDLDSVRLSTRALSSSCHKSK